MQQWFGSSDPAMEEALHDVRCTESSMHAAFGDSVYRGKHK